MVNKDGKIWYSNMVKLVSETMATASISFYPNPLKGKVLTLQMNNVAAGKYTVVIYNALGQKVVNQAIVHEGLITKHSINIGTQLSAGIYNISILGSEGKVSETKLSVE
jgi:lantibiotic modifying enzyme